MMLFLMLMLLLLLLLMMIVPIATSTYTLLLPRTTGWFRRLRIPMTAMIVPLCMINPLF